MSGQGLGQFAPELPTPLPPPAVTWTQEQDHRDMMRQLGITAMRPAPSGNQADPHHANYDEAKANPYPVLPDPLRSLSGEKITTAAMWWSTRRPELERGLEQEMYGRVPKDAPSVSWSVKTTDHEFVSRRPVVAQRLVGHVDNSRFPEIEVNIEAVLVLPASAKGAVPVLIMFGRPQLPAPAQPGAPEQEHLNDAMRAMLAARDPKLATILDRYPAYQPLASLPAASPFGPRPAAEGPPGFNGTSNDPPAAEQLIVDGWGYLTLNPTSVQADDGSGLTRGVIGLVNHGLPRQPDDWGVLRAWAWGASRALDYLETNAAVDARHVGIEGVSRYGKAALVAEAFDQRFFMGLIGSSGEGGAKLSRRNFGEAVENLTTGEYHWMAGNFLKYGAAEGKPGSVLQPGDLPVDAHDLIALCAPRLVFVSYGIPEHGDAKWLDQQGSFMATLAALPVYTLLGAPALGMPDDYRHATMPPVLTGLLAGKLAWRQHDGGHTDAPNVHSFIVWSDHWMGRSPVQ